MNDEPILQMSKKTKLMGKIAFGVHSLASISAGFVHGYYVAQGIPFDNAITENLLTYTPAATKATAMGAIAGIPTYLWSKKEVERGMPLSTKPKVDDLYAKIIKCAFSTKETATITMAGIAGSIGATHGALETLIGYGAGYLAGSLAK
tara:strand:+ start:322 stop:765 length:444 start_codon:yes stop_codon:yes gene_type:complete